MTERTPANFTMKDGALTCAGADDHCIRMGVVSGANATLNIEGGNLTATKKFYVGYVGNNKSVVNQTGGTVTVGMESGSTSDGLLIGRESYGYADGEYNISAGQLISYNDIKVGYSDGYGELNISGGSITQRAYTYENNGETKTEYREIMIGHDRSWSDGHCPTGVVNQTSGIFDMGGGSVSIGRESGAGFYNISGGKIVSTGTLGLATKMTSESQIPYTSGEINISGSAELELNTFTVGGLWTQDLAGTGVVNQVGGFVSANELDIGRGKLPGHGFYNMQGGELVVTNLYFSHNGWESKGLTCGGEFELRGGTVAVEKVRYGDGWWEVLQDSAAAFIFNGGVLKARTGTSDWFDSRIALSVRSGGMVVDTDGKNVTIQSPVVGTLGDGGIRKKGDGTLTLASTETEIAGPIVVEAGTLSLATVPSYVDIIRVAEDATLVLPRNVTCRILVNNGTIEGGTVTVDTTVGAITATWTGDAGDNDVTNVKNYAFTSEGGHTIYPSAVSEATTIKVPYAEGLPSFAGLDVTFVVDADLLAEGYAIPAVVKKAAAWYDPSDARTLTLNEDEGVVVLANKGTAGAELDMNVRTLSETKSAPTLDTLTFKGRAVLAFTGETRGLKTARGERFRTDFDKTIFCVDRKTKDDEWYPFLCGEDFGMSGFAELWSSKFRFRRIADLDHLNEAGEVSPEPWGGTLSIDSHGTQDNSCIRDMRFDAETVSGNIYSGKDNDVRSATPVTVALSTNETALCIGERSFYNGSSKTGLVGECLAFDYALADEEIVSVRAYLKAKWIDNTVTAVLGSKLEIANNSVIDLGGTWREFAAVAGAGRFKDGDVKVTGKITLTVNDDGTIDPLVVDGELDITGATLEIRNASKLPSSRAELTAISVGSVKGAFASVVGNRRVKVIYDEGEIRIRRDDGFAILIR